MRKIPTLFVRDPANPRYVTDEVTPGCEWVLAGEGVATRKYDGTCVMFDGTEWWARREVKPNKKAPPSFVAVEHDETTGKTVGWIPMEESDWSRWHAEALAVAMVGEYDEPLAPGTYELCGPKINGNPEDYAVHELVPHAEAQEVAMGVLIPSDLVRFFASRGWEGIVWHHPDGRMAKLKARDLEATP